MLCGLAAVGIAVAMAFQEDELISSIAAVTAIVALAAAALTRIADVLQHMARLADKSLSARIALRAFARDPRRPVSAIVIGSVSLALTVGILGTLSSVTAQDRATYVGNRHLDQVEALLYSGSDPRTVEQALAGVLPAGTPIAKGTYPVDEKLLKASPSPALTPSWSIAWLAGSQTDNRKQTIQVVDDEKTFTSLTGRTWSTQERKALEDGHILVLDPECIRGDRVILSKPNGLPASTDQSETRWAVGGAVRSDPVDATTLTRASACLTTRTAHSLGAKTVDYSVIASPRTSMGPGTTERLTKALEAADIVMADVRIETGPELTPPSLWYLMLGLALAAIETVLDITITSSASELRPDLVRLHRIGLSPGSLSNVVIWQSITVAVHGIAAGWGLTAARN